MKTLIVTLLLLLPLTISAQKRPVVPINNPYRFNKEVHFAYDTTRIGTYYIIQSADSLWVEKPIGTFKCRIDTVYSVGGGEIGGSIEENQIAFGTGTNTIGGYSSGIRSMTRTPYGGLDIRADEDNGNAALKAIMIGSGGDAIWGSVYNPDSIFNWETRNALKSVWGNGGVFWGHPNGIISIGNLRVFNRDNEVFNVNAQTGIVTTSKVQLTGDTATTDDNSAVTKGQMKREIAAAVVSAATNIIDNTNGIAFSITSPKGDALKINKSGVISGGEGGRCIDIARNQSGTGDVSGDIIYVYDNPTTSGVKSGRLLNSFTGSIRTVSLWPRATGSNVPYSFQTFDKPTGTLFEFGMQGRNKVHSDTTGNMIAAKYSVSSLNTAPSSSVDTGTPGEMRITADFIYICTAPNTWKRTAISTW